MSAKTTALGAGAASRLRASADRFLVALAGNPNSGKTTVFNALTGLRHKVGNYPGVTVERKMGSLRLGPGTRVDVLDLPGAYSLAARSPDEEIARKVLLGEMLDTPRPDVVVVVLDASNLERNLYLAGQVLETGTPTVLALNMMDIARERGLGIDAAALSRALDVPVVPMVASRRRGIAELKTVLAGRDALRGQTRRWRLGAEAEAAVAAVADTLRVLDEVPAEACDAEAIRLLGTEGTPERIHARGGERLRDVVRRGRAVLAAAGLPPATLEARERYRWIREVVGGCVERRPAAAGARDRVDAVLTHRVAGPILFLVLLALIFQCIFAWAVEPMHWMDRGIQVLRGLVAGALPAGAFRSLVVDGILGGVGAVIIFLPQIVFLFFFIGLLEDTGYMARVAFMMDRLMRRVGLHGKACIPLLSSFACAIPGIMATRTMESRRDRFVTILVAPLMSCSARLPIYTLVIAAFIPGGTWTKGLVLTGLYLFGVATGVVMALIFRRTLFRGEALPLLLELPPYRWPNARTLLLHLYDRARLFVVNAGTVIMAATIILWFLSSYPKPEAPAPGAAAPAPAVTYTPAEALRASFAGRLGRFLEPVIEPLGFDWRIGVGLVTSLAAREVFVSTMGTLYNVGGVGGQLEPLSQKLQEATWDGGPRAGMPIFTLPTAVALLIFYVLACQCVSTLAVVRRETGSWRWPLFLFSYMTVLAYAGAWAAQRLTARFF